ncbi:MBL fold metallo-hydrolase [Sinimarinibacterium sp. CAU 1509]|uniref:MBL fold metallo-hydrolase n=1 Tax=Sinimarinibacterium sp. CAU 1509 TaxID=2562283 RepID=UPI0010AD5040|nr:MBL fold metallo-hydrolase [Sinimarinibacterium sp. CAU 1509]TJY59852.1 MBL fold metallo-hydrolase [Sinimarinibacterium sp. CAU 1509]
MKPEVTAFYDPATFTISYVVREPNGKACAIVDPVLDYDPKAARTSTGSADAIIEFVEGNGLQVEWILETHAHADHLTGAQVLKERLGGRIAIGEHIRTVQKAFAPLFDLGADFPTDGSQFDQLFADNDTFKVGAVEARVLHTPGHTPACVTYVIGDAVFVGDTLFMPDYGTARADFPGADVRVLYRSIRRILELPPETRLFMCHDYQPGGRAPQWETTVAAERSGNVLVHEGVDEDAFAAVRSERDRKLPAPVLILPSLQVNIRAGRLPEPAANGIRYLKLPLDQLGGRARRG